MEKSVLYAVILALSFCFKGIGQISETDSLIAVLGTEISDRDRASTLQRLGPRFINSDPDSALLLAEQAFGLTKHMDDYEMHSRSYRRMGHALYVVGDWDRFRTSLLEYVDYAEANEDYFQVAASYRNLSKIGEATKQPDSSLFYLDKCMEVLSVHPDSVVLIDVLLSKGLTYKYKGYYEMSIEALLDGVRIAEAIGSKKKLGYLDMNLGITYNTMGRDEKCAFHMKRSIDYFKADGNLRGETRSTSNLGFAYTDLGRNDEAKQQFEEAIALAKQSKMPNIAMHSYMGLADLAIDDEDYDTGLIYVNQAEKIAKEIGADFTIGAAIRYKSKLALKMNNLSQARRYLNAAEQHAAAFREPIEESEYHREMADLYDGVGDYKKALSYTNQANALQDSVYTLKKEQQFAELNLIYETEKKDAEIELLNKNVEIAAIKRKGLWGGMGLLAIASLSFIYSQIQRRKKEKALFINEKNEEIKRRELAEQQLEFKKKELTANVLQLAKKNEFLRDLETEVTKLQSSVDQAVGKASSRISRMIQQDTVGDEEWEQFGKEFSSVHQEFLDRLKQQYGSFTKGEMRLIALLRMNMSSKDIASTLRISDDGIRKARYRLRKKMKLETSVDLAGLIMGL